MYLEVLAGQRHELFSFVSTSPPTTVWPTLVGQHTQTREGVAGREARKVVSPRPAYPWQ